MDQFKEDFVKADTDSDGYLSRDEFYEFFKKYDPDFYIGFATGIIDKFNYNGKNPDRITLPQALEYYSVYKNNIHYLFEIKYEAMKDIYRVRVDTGLEEAESHAPKEPSKWTGKPQNARVRFKVGSPSASANHLQLRLKKSETTAQDYFVKVQFKAESQEKADQLVESINNFYKNLYQTLLEEFPEAAYILNRLQVSIKKVNSSVEVCCRSNCPQLNEIFRLWISTIDQLSDSPTQIELTLKVDSDFSLKNFIDLNSENFYNLLAKDLNLELDLQTNKQVMHALNSIAMCMKPQQAVDRIKRAQFFYQPMPYLYGCWTQNLDVDIELDNTAAIPMTEGEHLYQQEMKMDLLVSGPCQLHQAIQEDYSFGKQLLEDLYSLAEGQIEVTGVINKVWVSIKLHIKELGFLYKKVCESTIEDDD